MEATQEALRRGREAGYSGKFEPVAVHHNGRLTAHVLDSKSERVEKVYEQQGRYYHQELGRKADGSLKVYEAKGELKRIVKAMLLGPHRDELIPEAVRSWRESRASSGNGNGRVRRKR